MKFKTCHKTLECFKRTMPQNTSTRLRQQMKTIIWQANQFPLKIPRHQPLTLSLPVSRWAGDSTDYPRTTKCLHQHVF